MHTKILRKYCGTTEGDIKIDPKRTGCENLKLKKLHYISVKWRTLVLVVSNYLVLTRYQHVTVEN